MKYISTKHLREKFSDVTDGLAYGDEFVLLYRSKPIAKIIPFKQHKQPKKRTNEEIDQLIKQHAGTFKSPIGQDLSPEKINTMIEEQYNDETK
jgi:antitoxin (DNA-binding transcriptional repressor) of toxin-antitoxin stability system